ncbi:MAG: ribosome silencing factor [Thermodesulfobacteriota bacterium]
MKKANDSWERVLRCAQSALDKKAYDLVILDVAKLTSIADFFLICTGRSDIQVQTICRHIEESLAQAGVKPLSVEGFTHGQWVLMDFGDVVVHIFYETVRDFYNLEGLWSQAPHRSLPEPYRSQARQLRLATA